MTDTTDPPDDTKTESESDERTIAICVVEGNTLIDKQEVDVDVADNQHIEVLADGVLESTFTPTLADDGSETGEPKSESQGTEKVHCKKGHVYHFSDLECIGMDRHCPECFSKVSASQVNAAKRKQNTIPDTVVEQSGGGSDDR